jgi:TM2 domain-containing membrane protein YozV
VGSAAIICVFIGGAALYEQGIHGLLWEKILFWLGVVLLICSAIWSRDTEAQAWKRADKRERRKKRLR